LSGWTNGRVGIREQTVKKSARSDDRLGEKRLGIDGRIAAIVEFVSAEIRCGKLPAVAAGRGRAACARSEAEDRIEATVELLDEVPAVIRCPGKPGVSVQDSRNGPAADDFFRQAVLALEKPGSPDAKQLEGVAHVVVGRAIVRRQVPFIQVAGVGRGIGVRTGIEGMAKAVLRVDRKRAAELVLQLEQKRVEVGRPVIRVVVDAGNVRIESIAVYGAHVVKVVLLGQMASGTSLITNGS